MQRCPHCQSEDVVRAERAGGEADYCRQCENWLDDEGKQAGKNSGLQDTATTNTGRRPPPPAAEDPQVRKNR